MCVDFTVSIKGKKGIHGWMQPAWTKCGMYIQFWQENLKENVHLKIKSSRWKSNYKVYRIARLETADWWQVSKYRILVLPCVKTKLNYCNSNFINIGNFLSSYILRSSNYFLNWNVTFITDLISRVHLLLSSELWKLSNRYNTDHLI